MDIIDFAMQMELDGQTFYEQAADATNKKELKEIFTYLADEEARHFRFFKQLRDGNLQSAITTLQRDSSVTIKNIFVDYINGESEVSFGDDLRTAWTQALHFEEKAVKLYTEEAENESDPERKALLGRIAEEEQSHVYLIDNMLSFMNDPDGFTDSKQFGDFQSWEGR